ncbi:MAG: hybrid sensor histidine kinase/response regulator transcription factor [Ktedonobacteraceae bacterium]
MSDELVQLIVELQRDASDASGRRRLLDYIRDQSGARLALLFALNESGDALLLLDQRGRRVRSQKSSQFAVRVPPDGLFGAALHMSAVLRIGRAAEDARVLDGERSWLAAGEDVVLSRVARHSEAKGVLVLCLQASSSQPPAIDENGLLFCAALLSAYMSPEEPRPKPRRTTIATVTQADMPVASVAAAVEQERARIARDMHDGVVQQLAAVLQRLELARRILETRPDAARRQLDEATLLINESLIELRHVIVSPIPLQLEEQGLTAALRKLAQETMRAEPLPRVEVESPELGLLPVTLEAIIYRLAQESLANARKHAQATRVLIRLRFVNGLLVVEISDNGQGFASEAAGHAGADADEHLGLRMMRSRVQQVGGTWEAQSRRGVGTTIKARFPLAMPLLAAALTNREREVLRLLTQGLTNRAIAEKLSVSAETVKSHLHHIMQKMQVHDRTQAAVTAARQQLM